MATVYDEGRTMSLSRDGVTVVRTLRVTPMAEVGYVCDLLLGGVRLFGGFLFRLLPARDPYLPWAICTSIEAEGLGTWTGDAESGLLNIVKKASYSQGMRLKVTYQTPGMGNSTLDPRDGDTDEPPSYQGQPPNGGGIEPTAQQEIDLASDTWDFRVQHMTLENSALAWVRAAGQQAVGILSNNNAFATKTIPHIEITLTRSYVIRPPFTALHGLLGRVNAAALTKGRKTFPAETFRFDGLKAMRKTTSFGVKHYEMQMSFAFMAYQDILDSGNRGYIGWLRKYDWKDQGGRWWYVAMATNTNKLLYDYDTDISQTLGGSAVSGFQLLFHPKAT